MKTYYSDYTRHCLRFYCRHRDPTFHNNADKKNWQACHKAFETLDEKKREMLIAIYADRDTVPDNVYQMSVRFNCKQDEIWSLIAELERRVAKKRGLL